MEFNEWIVPFVKLAREGRWSEIYAAADDILDHMHSYGLGDYCESPRLAQNAAIAVMIETAAMFV